MRILMLCDYFEPTRLVGAVRPTDFAKCFVEMGHEVETITLYSKSWPSDEKDSSLNVMKIDIDNSRFFKRYHRLCRLRKFKKESPNSTSSYSNNTSSNSHPSLKNRIFNYLRAFYATKIKISFGKCGSRAMYHAYRNQMSKYDLVYTTYGGFSSPLCGKRIKKVNKSVKWLVDFRDAVFYEMFVKANKSYFRYFIYKNCKDSDALIFASSGYLKDSILPKNYSGKISVIENGFLSYRESNTVKHEKLTFLYSGSMYGDRHLYSFFEAIRTIKSEYNDFRIEIWFCGDEKSWANFLHEAKSYSVDTYVVYQGFLTMNELTQIESKADAFLISSWNYKDYSGVLPGKLFEYFSFCKPIVGHICGDEPGSLLKQMINSNDLGFCSDDVEPNDYHNMYNFIKNTYLEFLKCGKITFKGSKDYLNLFLRKQQAKKIIDIMGLYE